MNVMLENAKRYFTPETKQYKVIIYMYILHMFLYFFNNFKFKKIEIFKNFN